MTASFPELLKKGRVGLGIEDTSAAAMFDLSIHEYCDLESHENEWRNVVPAVKIADVVNFFDIDWRTCATWPQGKVREINQDLGAFCRDVREKAGLTREAFADRVGFSPAFCEVVEGHPRGLSLWPVAVAVLLAEQFDIDSRSLASVLLTPA